MSVDREELLELLCGQYDTVLRAMKVAGVHKNDIEDLAEEVFVAAVKSIDDLRDEKLMGPWVKRITANKVSKYFRKRNRRREIFGMVKAEFGKEVYLQDLLVEKAPVERVLRQAEDRELVGKLLDTLPDLNRKILQMRFWGNYKFSEIAEILSLNENTVKSIYRRSLKRLKDHYDTIFGREES